MPIMCIFAVIVRNCVTTVNVFLFLNIHVLVALDKLSVPGYMYYLLGDKKMQRGCKLLLRGMEKYFEMLDIVLSE